MKSKSLLLLLTSAAGCIQSSNGRASPRKSDFGVRSSALKASPSCTSEKRVPTESLASTAILFGIRGGSDPYYNDDDDDYYHRRDDQGNDRGYGDNRGYGDSQNRDDYYGDKQYRDGDQYYDDKDFSRPSRSRNGGSNVASIVKNGDRRIGLLLLGGGGVLTMLGISLFFNKSLMRLGNLLFIAGVPMTIGPGRTAGYFLQPKKVRATGCLAFGIFLVFIGWPVFGIVLEVFGLLNLFGNMFPVVTAVLKNTPVIGTIFKAGSGSKKKSRRRDDYYDDDRYENDRGGSYDEGYDGGDSWK